MRKRYCIVAQIVLLLWFFLDMTGLYFGNKCLVTRSYKEDGICFLIDYNNTVSCKRKYWKIHCYRVDVNVACYTTYVSRVVYYF